MANNLSQWAYQGVEAGTLAAALGILESTPHEDMPLQVANGIAMMMVPHIISSAIHESPAAREKRLGQENASIYWAKKDASNDTKRNMNDIRDYRNVVNDQKGVVFQKDQDLRTLLVNPKSKPEDINKAKDAYQEADEKLTQLMSANAETMHEYGRQQDLLFANIHRGLNGPLRAGQSNIGLEILTKDQILQKLVDQNKELASTPQGMAKLEMIAGQDGMVINSAGGVELRVGTDLAEALKNEPIMFDPSKTTAIINSDNARTRAGVYGTTTYDAISHEGGHLYGRTEEFQKANSELLSQLFSTNIYHNDGTIASEDFGAVSNDQLKDMIWNNYLKRRTDEQKKDWLESQGMWDRANDRFIDKEVIPYAREEYIAEMAGNSLHQMTSRGGETAVMKWARVNNSNNMLARSIQSVLGNGGPDPTKPSPVMGIKFTPEIAAATEKAIQAVNDYNGHIAPVIDAQPVVEITQQELKKNKGLLKKYGIQSGMFQTQIFATIRDANGNIVGKVPVSNEATPEGSWKIDPNTRRPVQTNGYGQIPDEVNNVQIPEGGSLDVKREVAMQPDGESPIMLSDSQIKKNQKARRDLILNALGITGEIPDQGITWRGTFTPEQIQNIKNLPENVVPKSIKDVILSMNETLASGEGKRWLTEYSPTSGKKGKRKSLMMKMYDVVPIGMHFTKDGNFNVTVISATRIFNKLHAWGAEFPHILDMWGGDKSAFFNDFVTKYLANWKEGKAGETGLDPDPKIAEMKRDIFNNFLNLKDKDTDPLNQNRFYLKGKMADLDRTIMSMRADHVSSLQPSSAQPIPVDYYKAKINAMPESGLPYQERPEEGEEAPKETLTFAPKGEQPALTPEILKGITAVHVPASKLDETYAKAIESGDMEEAQRLVDEKARQAGYTVGPVYHGSSESNITSFDPSKAGTILNGDWGRGVYFTPAKWMADAYKKGAVQATDGSIKEAWGDMEKLAKKFGTTPMMVWIDLQQKKITQEQYDLIKESEEVWRSKLRDSEKGTAGKVYDTYLKLENPLVYNYEGMTDPYLAGYAKSKGHDGIIIKNKDGDTEEILAFSPEQIKSADPATYDNEGKLIPLSQRFDTSKSDIRFMPKGQTQAAKPIDWSVFTQKTEKPLSTIRAYAVPQQQKDKSY